VIDDDEGLCTALTVALEDEFAVEVAPSGSEGLARLQEEPIPLVLLDMRMPGMPGLEVLRRIHALDPAIAVVMHTVRHDIPVVVRAMQDGAVDFLPKPCDVDVLRARLHQALRRAQRHHKAPATRRGPESFLGETVLGDSRTMRHLWDTLRRAADTPATVLLTGESGTGKEYLARALHQMSPRYAGPFVARNCAALPSGLIESELLGHERGAFTGAERRRLGAFELAHTGTLFLDEISDLPLAGQAALLRVLQDRTVQRLGSERPPRPVDVRVVAATNQDLPHLVATRRFREDLFYRLYVIPLTVPPLRTRRGDIPLFVEHFLAKYAQAYGRPAQGVTVAALDVLCHYAWPGNVRELEHCLARLIALSDQPLLDAAAVRAALELPEPEEDRQADLDDVEDGGAPQ
jgi:DNA-binding NtrC family response regulator